MGSGEVDKSLKEDKTAKKSKTPASQEQTSVASSGPVAEWPGFQAYSPMPPHGFVASSPQAHPYMWGVQQFIPPYGTPLHPYVAMYPNGGMYAHPTMSPGSYPFSPFAMPSPNSIAEASGTVNVEVNDKSVGKEKLPIKRSKGRLGSLNVINGKNNEPRASANGVHSKSAESASEASNEGSYAHSQNDSQAKSRDMPDSAEPSQNDNSSNICQNERLNPTKSMVNQTMGVVPILAAGAVSGVPSPTTNLNMGMDYWGTTSSSVIPAIGGKVQSHISVQDERELKRQKRKLSNRESARRSRLRKQAECDELTQQAQILKEENASLRSQVARIRSEYEQLLAHNSFLKKRLGELPDQEDPRCSRGNQHAYNDSKSKEPTDHMQRGL